MQHHHAVGQHDRLVQVVGDQHHRHVEDAAQFGDFAVETLARRLVDGGEGLVEQQHLRLACQRARHRHALLLAAGQLRRPTHLEPRQVHQIEQDPRPAIAVGRRHMPHRRHDVPERGHVRKQRIALEHHADGASMRWNMEPFPAGKPRFAIDPHSAVVRSVGAGDRPQDRRLAAAGRADQRQDLARRAGEGRREGDRRRLSQMDIQTRRDAHPSRRPMRREKA